jgi:hypothetical protein
MQPCSMQIVDHYTQPCIFIKRCHNAHYFLFFKVIKSKVSQYHTLVLKGLLKYIFTLLYVILQGYFSMSSVKKLLVSIPIKLNLILLATHILRARATYHRFTANIHDRNLLNLRLCLSIFLPK